MMTVKELVEYCEIVEAGNDKIRIKHIARGKKHIEEIKSRKPEILAYLAAKKAAEEAAYREREAKIKAIAGLADLEAAINAEEEYHNEFNRRMENEALSSFAPARPAVSSKVLAATYPRAAAYIKAEAWSYASHYAKAAAGRKALDRIINGEDYEQVLADMVAEWTAHCNEHIWD
jgi:hypothetical protein